MNPGSIEFVVDDGGNNDVDIDYNSVSFGRWYHVVAVYDDRNAKMYVNGREIGQDYMDNSIRNYDTNLQIGGDNGGTRRVVNGKVDDVKIYSKALKKSQIVSLYQEGAAWKWNNFKDQEDPDKIVDLSFQHKSGSNVYDTSGYQNNGQAQNGASQEKSVDCKVGRCYSFDGNDDYVSVSSSSELDSMSDGFTWMTWFKGDQQVTDYPRIIDFGDTTLRADGTSGSFRAWFSTDGSRCGAVYADESDLGNQDNEWHHATVVYNVSDTYLYVDGNLQDQNTCSGTLDTGHSLSLGSNNNGGAHFKGNIDQVKLFNRSLTQKEIIQKTEGLEADGAALELRLDEGGGDIVRDTSINSNYGTLQPNETAGPRWTDGLFGKALEFDGVNDQVVVSSDQSINLDGKNFTITSWVKPEPQGSHRFVYQKWRPNIYLSTNDNNWNFELEDGNGNQVVTLNAPMDGVTWYYTVQTVDQNNNHCAYIYDTSKLVDSSCTSIGITQGSDGDNLLLSQSGWHGSNNEQFEGSIDEVNIFKHYMNSQDVEALYRHNKPFELDQQKNSSLDNDLVLFQNFDRIETCGQSDTTSCPSGMSGEIAVDESGEANHGDLVNSPEKEGGRECKIGNCMKFDFVDGHVDFGAKSSLNLKNSLTISLWTNLESIPSEGPSNHRIIQTGSYNLDYRDNSGLQYQLVPESGWSNRQQLRTGYDESAGWVHVVGTYDKNAGIIKIYVDGDLKDSTSFNKTLIDTSQFLIGGGDGSGDRIIKGHLDQLRIYNRSLSQEEIWKLYNKDKPAGWWRFDEVSSSVITQKQYNSNIGADGNGQTVSVERVDFDEAGWYKLSYSSSWHSETAGGRHIMKNWLRKNGGSTVTPSEVRCYIRNSGYGDSCSNEGTVLVNVNAGDYIELLGTKDSGTGGSTVTVEDHHIYTEKLSEDVAQVWDDTGGQNYDSGTITLNLDTSTKVDSAYTFNSGSDNIQVNEDGWYKAYYTVNNHDTGQGDRQVPHSWLRVNGNTVPPNSADSYSYIRNSGGGDQNHQTGTALLNLNSGDYVQVRQEKAFKQSSGTSVTMSDMNWLMLEKVNSDNILQIIESTGGQRVSDGTTESIIFDTNQFVGEQFSHSTSNSPEEISINQPGWYEVSYVFGWDDSNAQSRHRVKAWLERNGEKLDMSEQRDYTRGCCNGQRSSVSVTSQYHFREGDTLELKARTEGGYIDTVAKSTYITITPVKAAPDASGNRDGELYGGPNFVSGKNSQAIEFDGNDDYISVSGLEQFDDNSKLSISAWVRRNGSTRRADILNAGKYDTLLYTDSSSKSGIYIHDGSTSYSAKGSVIPEDQWVHLTGTYDGSKLKIYENGKLKDSRDLSVQVRDSGSTTHISDNSLPFKGRIDDVRVYPYALSQEEVKQVMNEGGVQIGG